MGSNMIGAENHVQLSKAKNLGRQDFENVCVTLCYCVQVVTQIHSCSMILTCLWTRDRMLPSQNSYQ